MPVDAAATDITKGSQYTAAIAVADSGHRNLKRLVSQFAILSLAEVICRLISLVVVVELARRVGRDGYGRIEFSFNIVFWLIFVLRDGVELVFCREVAKRPRPKPRLVNAFLSLKLFLAIVLWLFLAILSLVIFRQWHDRVMLCSYGALLMTTALGLDNVFRGREKPGIVALSLVVRSCLYACGVWFWVHDRSRLEWVPWLLAGAEFLGIMIVWVRYSLEFGIPRPRLATRAEVWCCRIIARQKRSGNSACTGHSFITGCGDCRRDGHLEHGWPLWGPPPIGHSGCDIWPDISTSPFAVSGSIIVSG